MTLRLHPDSGNIHTVGIEKWKRPFHRKRPGDLVTHEREGGFGVLIARNKSDFLVLWSIEPRWNPMSIEEDFYLPKNSVERLCTVTGQRWCRESNCKCGRK